MQNRPLSYPDGDRYNGEKECSIVMGLMDVSVFIIAIAVCFLVFYLIRVLKSMERSLNQTEETIAQIKTQIDQLGEESARLLQHTNQIVVDLDKKSRSLNPLFQSIEETGLAAQQLSSTIMQISSALTHNVKSGIEKSAKTNHHDWPKILQAISLGYYLARKWKERNKGTPDKDA